MPTMDTNSKRDYQECIDTITSTVEAKSQVSWILCGDFNATLNPLRCNAHDKIFRLFTKNLSLLCQIQSLDIPTFIQHSGNSKSQIDYFLTNRHNLLGPTTVDTNSAANTSAHKAIKTSIFFAKLTATKNRNLTNRSYTRFFGKKVIFKNTKIQFLNK